MIAPKTGHSSDVILRLVVSQQTLEVERIGPDALTLRTPIDHAPCRAEFILSVDGREHRWPIDLPEGLSASQRKVRLN